MSTSERKLRIKIMSKKYVKEAKKKLQNSLQLCGGFREFDALCKELKESGYLTMQDEAHLRDNRRKQGKIINSQSYSKNVKLYMIALESAIKTQESLRDELLEEKNNLIAEITSYEILMNSFYSDNMFTPQSYYVYNTPYPYNIER
ncbi:hypothetical protein LOD99_5577 [Oopsacas minuta]|uniref:Uncharacterized protein n=1 Tax=Oopsacas minuta TaxID=111878 RepID=A0AAV7JQ07_9METZ|nr:hypothetical protein LOD99_5577 [Oopsacas minuta]